MKEEQLKRLAFKALEGVGDCDAGEWCDFTGYAYHWRRRLTKAESLKVGGVLDIRGTAEAMKRFEKLRAILPEAAIKLALEEMAPAATR